MSDDGKRDEIGYTVDDVLRAVRDGRCSVLKAAQRLRWSAEDVQEAAWGSPVRR